METSMEGGNTQFQYRILPPEKKPLWPEPVQERPVRCNKLKICDLLVRPLTPRGLLEAT